MKIQDLSVRKRLLFSNFIMVVIPVLLLLFIGSIVFLGLRMTGNAREKEIALLWPESGSSLSLQMSLSQLRTQMDHNNHNSKKLREICQSLESQGLSIAISKDDATVVYETQPGDAATLNQEISALNSPQGSLFHWDDQHVVFRYISPKNNMQAIAIGNVPFQVKNSTFPPGFKDVLETIAYIIIGISVLIIILTGVYLSRQLSRQIVSPLERLRYTAGEISKGNLDQPIPIDSNDELGDTCREFEKMRVQLKAARETREKYEHSRRELIAGISHDLSTPLTRVKGYASGLIDGIANTPEKKQHYFDMIYQTAISMETLVSSLFLFSKLELGQAPFHWESVDLSAYLADFVTESHDTWQARGLTLTLTDTATNSVLAMDRMQFQRVVTNIMENSLKYKDGPQGSLAISLRNTDREHVQLDFADSGIGVAPRDLSKLFDSFYRTDPARTNVANGSGLGLAIVKQIILAMNGQIEARQTDPQGLTIRILLPISKEDTHEKDTNC